MLELKNIYGNGNIKVYGSEIRAFDLNLEIGDYVIDHTNSFNPEKDSYVIGTTIDNQYLVFKVDSFKGDNINLVFLDKLVFNNLVFIKKLNEDLLLIQRSQGDNTFSIYNVVTKNFIYSSTEVILGRPKIFYGNDKNIILYSDRNKYNGEIAFIKDGAIKDVIGGVEYACNSRAFGCDSGKSFYIKLNSQDICYALSFNEDIECFKLEDTFDLFINLLYHDIAFAVKDSQLFLYDKVTNSSRSLRNFGNRKFKVHPVLSFEDFYRHNPYMGNEPKRPFGKKNNSTVTIPATNGIFNTTIPVVSITFKGVKEFVGTDGLTTDIPLDDIYEMAYKGN